MANIIGGISLAFLLSASLIGCTPQKGEDIMTRYEWLPSECAHEDYPMEIVKGEFFFNDESSIYIPAGKAIHNGWGGAFSTHIVGDPLKPIPARLSIHWFSYTEDKFYKGIFELPYDRIANLFAAGIDSPLGYGRIAYDRIIVGLAPEGEVGLWLSAESAVLKVSSFRAREVATDWKAVLDNPDVSRGQYIDMVLGEAMDKERLSIMKEDGIPVGLWDSYRAQYRWGPEIRGAVPLTLWVKTFNGESEYFDFGKPQSQRTHRSIPKSVEVVWLDAAKEKYIATVSFNENEVIAAFQKLGTNASAGHEMYFEIEISEQSGAIDVFVKDTQFILKLEKVNVDVFRL